MNRIPDCKVLSDKEIKQKSRETSVVYVIKYDEKELNNVIWKDYKNVLIMIVSA